MLSRLNTEVTEGLTSHYLTLLHSQGRHSIELWQQCICVCVFSSKPELHLWASTQQREAQQSDVSTGMKPACGKKMGNKGVEDGEWGGFGPYSGVTLLPCSSALPVT